MHFFIAYFLGENSKFGIETLHTVRDNHWFRKSTHACNKMFEPVFSPTLVKIFYEMRTNKVVMSEKARNKMFEQVFLPT